MSDVVGFNSFIVLFCFSLLIPMLSRIFTKSSKLFVIIAEKSVLDLFDSNVRDKLISFSISKSLKKNIGILKPDFLEYVNFKLILSFDVLVVCSLS